ncbi:MAG: fibronectin type III domain-containing protein [Opitutaceae bacterium]|nr:fibronectin type III domain-containing protein [Opitutaceae bacterium]
MKGLTFCTFTVVSIAGFLAPNATAGQLTLSWTDNSDNESGFRIERSTEGVSFTEIGTVGANTTLFVDTFVTSFTAYSYRVRAYNSSGNSNYSNVRNSSLDLLQQPGSNDRLIGTSIRAQVKKDSGTMIAGFVIKGTGNKQVLLRAVGPSLADYGVSGVINDPRITLYQGNTIIASNDNWSTSSNTALISTSVEQIGISQLPQGSKDAALLLNLSPGAYTAHITGVDGATGAALVEVYDADEAFDITSTSNLTAISMRGEIGTGSDVVIAGFVVAGSEPKRLLIRVVGPELSHFGVPGALNDPLLKLYKTVNGETFEISSNNDWGTNASQITTVSNQVGVSALDEGSKSAALVIWLEPGVYTVHSTSSSGSGVALVEVYEAP